MDEKVRAYVTKWALSGGIMELDGIVSPEIPTVFVPLRDQRIACCLRNGEWHRTLEGACREAERMRKRKLAALRRQMERLKATRFCPEAYGSGHGVGG